MNTIYENPQWKVLKNGDVICKDVFYEISRCTLESIEWETHLSEKSWCNRFYLKTAIDYSLKNTVCNG